MSGEDEDLLRAALACVAPRWSPTPYRFTPVRGGTQAAVWHGAPIEPGLPEVALRLTPKPEPLITRIGALVDGLTDVERPATLAVAPLEGTGRGGTVHVCVWIGKGAADRSDPHGLGQSIARLHLGLAREGADFTDRTLSFERGPVPSPEQDLPAWYVARHLWRDRILPRFAGPQAPLRPQPIHGDMHWDNVVAGSGGGFGFIDFDKVMHAPPVFDLAKLLATGFFRVTPGSGNAVFHQSRAVELLDGYHGVRPLTDADVGALEGFAVILNEETARLGNLYDVPAYRDQADAIGTWWRRRRRRNPGDPLGIRSATAFRATPGGGPRQLTIFPDPEEPRAT
jgi:hypothetical protein